MRSRADLDVASEAIGLRKQRQVARVAEHYLATRQPPEASMRFDAVVLEVSGAGCELVRDAWRV